MPIAWTESQTLKLVILYSRHECLRNPFHPDFNSKLCRYKAYKQIVDSMNICRLTVCDCIKRITYIKTQYCYELTKVSAAISCEKFYKPRASWFPIMHEILFPFINTYGCADSGWQIRDDEKRTLNDYYCNKANDQLMYSDAVELNKTPNKDCSCSYANCRCEPYRGKPRTRSKKPRAQAESEKVTDYPHLYSRVNGIDAGCGTAKCITAECEQQTDVSCFQDECAACEICAQDSPVKNGLKEAAIDEDYKGKREACDEFEMFGRSIASQLRNINFDIFQFISETKGLGENLTTPRDAADIFPSGSINRSAVAIKLERRIQDLIAQERLDNIKSQHGPHTIRSDCCSSSCSDCKVMRKDMVCSCGLPVIMIKTDQSRELDCK